LYFPHTIFFFFVSFFEGEDGEVVVRAGKECLRCCTFIADGQCMKRGHNNKKQPARKGKNNKNNKNKNKNNNNKPTSKKNKQK